jgi:trans-aconitate 2-methyltransferase
MKTFFWEWNCKNSRKANQGFKRRRTLVRYTFGTSKKAANRLKEIAKYFNPLAYDFIRQFLQKPVRTALDLGCGPGFTTNMLKQATGCKHVYGFDLSDFFLKQAGTRYPAYHFIKHDVTDTPFPINADIIYTRFLLSHLKNAVKIVDNWTAELPAGGLLFLDEVEDVLTEVNVFKKYLAANCGLIASQGAELYIGKTIGQAAYAGNVVCNESALLPVLDKHAAAWFYPNTITIWEKEEYIRKQLTQGEREDISCKLEKIMTSKSNNSRIIWKMRRVVIRKEV